MNLKEAVITAASAAQAKSPTPILSTLAINAENGIVEFTGSDLQIGIKTSTRYDMPDLKCCVDAKRLVAAIGVIDRPEFKLTDNSLIIKQGKIRFTLPYRPFETHPGLPELHGDGIDLGGDIVKMMAAVKYAAGKNDVRFFLNGVYINATDGELSIVASDGHRVAIRTTGIDAECQMIIPSDAVDQIIKFRPDQLLIGRMLHCLKADFEMVCTPIDSKYPDFKKILVDSGETMTIDRADITQTLSALSVLRDMAPVVGVRLAWKDNVLSALVRGSDTSAVENQVPATYTSESEIAINLAYLVDMIRATSGDEVAFSFAENQSSISIRRDNALDLVMSMKI